MYMFYQYILVPTIYSGHFANMKILNLRKAIIYNLLCIGDNFRNILTNTCQTISRQYLNKYILRVTCKLRHLDTF